jgi:asparagine synthase (glutamine-hydrolysing)
MCGILVLENNKNDTSKIDLLNHRGGTDSNTIQVDRYSLSHNRLQITGDLIQPFERDNIIALVNGEFYNYEKYIEEFNLKSNSDSEIIIPLYIKYGLDFINYLNGEYSFVIYDKNKDLLLFSRDNFGTKPLYFRLDDNIEISSEIKTFDNLKLNNLNDVLSMQYTRNNIFNVEEVKPGRLYLYQDKVITTINTFKYQIGTKKDTSIRDTLIKSVLNRVKNVDLSLTLSGGIDSALISSIASKILNKNIETFSVAFIDNDKFNEVKDIERIIKHNKIVDSNILYLDIETLFASLEDAVIASEGISVNIHVAAKYLLFKEISNKGYKINISGEGSDELFWGYQHLVAEVQDIKIPDVLKGYMNKSDNGKCVNYTNLTKIPNFLEGKFEIGNMIHDIFLNKENMPIIILEEDLNTPYLSHKLWLDLCFTPYILTTLGDKLEMAHNVEGRLPFLDKELTKIAFNTDLKSKIDKRQLKEEFKDILPEFLINKAKHPFIGPQLLNNDNIRNEVRIIINKLDTDKWNKTSILHNLDKLKDNITFNSAIMIMLSIYYLEKNLILK